MHVAGFLEDILILLAAVLLVVPVCERLRLSPVIGYLLVGIALGPSGLAWIEDGEVITQLAEIGIVFLLFTLGLELSVERLTAMRRFIFGLGSAQVVLTGLAFFALSIPLGLPTGAGIVIAAALALSSTAVVLQVLNERGELQTRLGRIAFSVLLMQDLAVAPILAMVPIVAAADFDLSPAVGMAVGQAVAALVAILLIGRYALRPVLHLIAISRNREMFLAIVLLIALGTAVATQAVGLSLTLGAFLAGLLLAETEFRHQVEADIEPFRGILLGLFFVTTGMLIDLSVMLDRPLLILLMLAAIILLKAAILVLLAMAAKQTAAFSLHLALVLCQGGEFAFVILTLALGEGLVDPALASILIVTVALSMAVTPALAGLGARLDRSLRQRTRRPASRLDSEGEQAEAHVIIAGLGRTGQTIAKLLDEAGLRYLAFEVDPEQVAAARKAGFTCFYGDVSSPDLLRRAGLDRARALVVTIDQAHVAQRIIAIARQSEPDLYIASRARDLAHARALTRLGANDTVIETLEASLQLGRAVLVGIGGDIRDVAEALNAERARETESVAAAAEARARES